MYLFLAKKIAIPNGVKLRSLSWNPEQGWLVCGGDDAMLKVLKLDVVPAKESNVKGVAAQTTLSMNQTLEGHKGAITYTTWNPQFKKLTTSDNAGLIIVWALHKGMWFEEMINNRGKSVVGDMRWRPTGSEICIAYEDGMIILGGVDGTRLWSKDLGAPVRFVEWAPDGHVLLFAKADGTIDVHSHTGVRLGCVPLPGAPPGSRLVALEWYDGVEGLSHPTQPTLALAWADGTVQLMMDEEDESPLVVDSGLALTTAKWNSNGTVLALCGSTRVGHAEVHCYGPAGRLLTSLRVPGASTIASLSWEGGGLRMALAVDSFVYFAAVRPVYRWSFFGGSTLAYAYARPDKHEAVVVFTNARAETRHIKYVRGLTGMAGHGDYCLMVSRTSVEATGGRGAEEDAALAASDPRARPTKMVTTLILSNSIGTPLESRTVELDPVCHVIGPTHVAVASAHTLHVWHYRTPGQKVAAPGQDAGASKRREGKEKTFQLDASDGSGVAGDGVTCLAVSERVLLVGRASGAVVRYALPGLTQEAVYTLRCKPVQVHINSNDTRFAVIDASNVLTFFDMHGQVGEASSPGTHLPGERRDVWDVLWAADAPGLCAVMEKTRLYVLRDGEPEEPALSSGYLCSFSDLTITSALLDEVYAAPDRPLPVADILVRHEVRSLRDTRALIAGGTASIKDAVSFVQDKAHPRLWRLLAETALEQLDLGVAESAYVSTLDYAGLQFVKRLRLLREPGKQKAEVAAYLGRFDEAEAAYMACDRKDLALDLRQRIEDWPRVLELLESTGGDVGAIKFACERMGEWCADRQQWRRAVEYHERSSSLPSLDALIPLYYTLEDYAGLVGLVARLPPAPQGSASLSTLAFKLQTVGLTDAAADAYLKAGEVKAALDCCIGLSQWERALAVAQEHGLPQVQGLLAKYVAVLTEGGKHIAAVELYRKAGRHADAAKVLAKLGAESMASRGTMVRAKKLFVLSAMEVQRHRAAAQSAAASAEGSGAGGAAAPPSTASSSAASAQRRLGGTGNARGTAGTSTAAATLATVARMDAADMVAAGGGGEHPAGVRALDAAWHGAEGVHFFLLAQRQLFSGDPTSALLTLGFLLAYEDVVSPSDVAALTALAGYYAYAHASVSKALARLKGAPGAHPSAVDAVDALALDIFTRHKPVNPPAFTAPTLCCPTCRGLSRSTATSCDACEAPFKQCVATGRALAAGGGDTLTCGTCRHSAYAAAVRARKSCPLCHAPPAPG